jgi:hypothetical protein
MARWIFRNTVTGTARCKSLVEYLERYYPGDRSDGKYLLLYQSLEGADTTLREALAYGGEAAVDWVLDNNNQVEIAVNGLAVEWDVLLHGDSAAAAANLAVRPPGQADLLPSWALESGRNVSRDLFRQAERITHGSSPGSSSQMPGAGLRRRGWINDAVPNAGGPPAGGNPQPPGPKGPKPKPPKKK